MQSEWRDVRLDEVAELKGGYAFKSEEYTPSGRFVLRTVNISESGRIVRDGAAYIDEGRASQYERFDLRPLDTVFVMVGATLGKAGLITSCDLPALLNQNMWVVRALEGKINPLYLHYRFRESSKKLIGFASGSARGFVRRDDFRAMRFRLPPREVQDEFAIFVGSVDDRIALLRESNATMESLATTMFKSWFIDFDPVRAKAEGREPEGMSADIAALFPSEFIDSELGLIPKGWQVRSIGDVVECVGGGTPSTKEPAYWEGGTHNWASPKDLSGADSPILLDTAGKLTDAGLGKVSSGLLPAGTVLMSSRAPIGYLAIAGMPTAINQGFIAMKSNDRVPNSFLMLWTRENMEEIKSRANGSTFMEISKAAFRPIPVVLPDEAAMNAFREVSGPLFDRIAENARQAETLTNLRDILLPRLLSGVITVPT